MVQISRYLGASGLDLGSQRITNLADASAANDAVNLGQLQSVQRGTFWKDAARASSTTNVTISAPGASIDGVTLSNGDRVLLKNQTAGAENGVYVFNGSAAAMTRATDMNSSANFKAGNAVYVDEGSVNADTAWTVTTDGTITPGTTSVAWARFGGGNTYTAGNGLSNASGTFSVLNNGSSIDVSSSGIKVGTGSAGNGVSVSGTGVISANIGAGLVNSSGQTIVDTGVVARWFSNSATHGAGTTVALTHNLNRLAYVVSVTINSTGEEILADITKSLNAVTATFGSSQAANTIQLTVVG